MDLWNCKIHPQLRVTLSWKDFWKSVRKNNVLLFIKPDTLSYRKLHCTTFHVWHTVICGPFLAGPQKVSKATWPPGSLSLLGRCSHINWGKKKKNHKASAKQVFFCIPPTNHLILMYYSCRSRLPGLHCSYLQHLSAKKQGMLRYSPN